MPDLLEGGDPGGEDGERGGLTPLARAALGLVVVVLAAFVLSRAGLLSSGEERPDRPDRVDRPTPSSSVVVPTVQPALVVRDGDRLVRLDGQVPAPGTTVPEGLDDLLVVPLANGRDALFGVVADRLVRANPYQAASVREIADAERVVGAAAAPGRVLVVRDGGVLELQAGDGRVTDARPFWGAGRLRGEQPAGLVQSEGARALVLVESGAAEPRLSLAWQRDDVLTRERPQTQVVPSGGAVAAISDEWIVRTVPRCPGPSCPLTITSVLDRAVSTREVLPPDGWEFAPEVMTGVGHDLLVGVRAGEREAMARVVSGGAFAVLVGDSEGADLDAGAVAGTDGAVYFVVRDAGEEAGRLHVWLPGNPAAAVPVPDTAGVPAAARLVCACR
jgi:hypothetical protein